MFFNKKKKEELVVTHRELVNIDLIDAGYNKLYDKFIDEKTRREESGETPVTDAAIRYGLDWYERGALQKVSSKLKFDSKTVELVGEGEEEEEEAFLWFTPLTDETKEELATWVEREAYPVRRVNTSLQYIFEETMKELDTEGIEEDDEYFTLEELEDQLKRM